MKNKAKVIIVILCVLVVGSISFYYYYTGHQYSYEWVEVKESSIGQYILYVNNARGEHIDGTVRIVYINGKSKRVEVDKEGLLYVKSIVAEVRNPNRR